MDLEEIKRGLRAEIKKRENEQYFTFQCNVRQMCKDVLAKIEEQETEIAELKAKLDKVTAERDGNQVCIDALKAKLEDAKATAYAESVDAGMRERRLKRHCTRRARIGRITEYSFDLMPTRRGGRIWNANA